MAKIFLVLLLGIFLITLTSGTVNDLGTFPKGDCVEIKQICGSCSYVNLTISYPNSTRAVTNAGMDSVGSATWTYDFCDTSTDGRYDISGEGDISGTPTGFDGMYFNINEGGIDFNGSTVGGAITLLLILCGFFVGSSIIMYRSDHYIVKFIFYWVSHVLLILITFVAWQMGVEGLLGSVALTGIFRILFLVSSYAVIPMVIVSMSWIFYIHVFNEHFEKLISKGMDTESAFKLAGKKTGGWMNGK